MEAPLNDLSVQTQVESKKKKRPPRKISDKPSDFLERLKTYLEKSGFSTYSAGGEHLGVPHNTLRDWLVNNRDPSNKLVLKRIERVMASNGQASSSGQNVASNSRKDDSQLELTPTEERTLVATESKILELTGYLNLCVGSSENLRWALRNNLGKAFVTFLTLSRALTNEQMRERVLRDGEIKEGGLA